MRFVIWEIVISVVAWGCIVGATHSIVETNAHAAQRQEMYEH